MNNRSFLFTALVTCVFAVDLHLAGQESESSKSVERVEADTLPYQDLPINSQVEIITVNSPEPLEGELRSLGWHPSRKVVTKLGILDVSGKQIDLPVQRILKLKTNESRYIGRYDSKNRNYQLEGEEAALQLARSRLASSGHLLLPEISLHRRSELVGHELAFISERAQRLSPSNRRLVVKEHPALIVVSDLPPRQLDEIFARAYTAIAGVATYLRLPSKIPLSDGKPIVVVFSGSGEADQFQLKQFESDLKSYLLERGFESSPLLIVETAENIDEEFLNRLYRDAASRFLARAHSDKSLPAWVEMGLIQLGEPPYSKTGQSSTAARIRVPGNLKQTMTTKDRKLVDETIALELMKQLYLIDPNALPELLFDLKHGLGIDVAMKEHFDTTLSLQLNKLAKASGMTFDFDTWEIARP